MITAERYHDISCGHRVVGHESKCRHLHGHNYRVHFVVSAELDAVGRVLDFSVIKERLCMWLEDVWDHKFLMWIEDPMLVYFGSAFMDGEGLDICIGSVVAVPFNPTAENMADYLLRVVGPKQLEGTGVTLVTVTVEETMKCAASSHL
jgi:6-pyruvoyltetrahydropterin/6-carboxytetrahydropterin synthase